MWIEEYNEEVGEPDELQDILCEQLDEYCQQLEKEPGMIITLEEADKQEMQYEESWSFLWSDKACKLIQAEEKRLWDIGQKYYPHGDITVESSYYREM